MSRLRTMSLPSLAAVALVTFVACDHGGGEIRGDSLFAADCDGLTEDRLFEPFAMGIERLGFTEDQGVVTLRLMTGFRTMDQTDMLVIALTDSADLRAEIAIGGGATRAFANPGAVSDALPNPNSAARGGFALLDRCTPMPQALVVGDGVLTLAALGDGPGDKVAGRMTFNVVDRRTGAVVGDGFTADFDFEIALGSPFTPFAPDDEYWSLTP